MNSTVRHKHRFLSGAALALGILLSVWRSFTPDIIRINETTFDAGAAMEAALWCVVVIVLGYSLWAANQLQEIKNRLRSNFVLIIFLTLASVSIAWSAAPVISFYRLIALLGSAWVGIYLGVTKDENKLLEVLFWAGVVFIISSYELAMVPPLIGRMFAPPYTGAWCGLFWHKNFLGAIMSFFACIYLFRALRNIKDRMVVFDLLFYFLSLGLVVLSRSAAGFISLLFMHAFLLVAFLWVRIAPKLRRSHYLLAGASSAVLAVVFFLNLDRFFALFNRSTDLTGRMQLWRTLLEEVVAQRPFLGHGFGALWYLESFRVHIQQVVGWTYQVKIGDNGFIDILLHLGLVGLLVFVALFLLMIFRSVRYVFSKRTLVSFLPLLILFYALIGNISFSLFFESENFIWMLMVAALFLTSDQGVSTA